jgi:Rrf2 family protein
MVDLARYYGGKARSLTEISQAEGLVLKLQYLEQLVKSLREANLVESTRGAHGGYRLSRAPDQIRLSEVLRVLEGPVAPMICATEGDMDIICDRLDGCSTKFLWMRVRDAVAATLDSITLADLVVNSPAPGAGAAQFASFTPRLSFTSRRKEKDIAGQPSAN